MKWQGIFFCILANLDSPFPKKDILANLDAGEYRFASFRMKLDIA